MPRPTNNSNHTPSQQQVMSPGALMLFRFQTLMKIVESFKVVEWQSATGKYDWAKSCCELVVIVQRSLRNFTATDEATDLVVQQMESDIQGMVVFKVTQSIVDHTRRSEFSDKITELEENEDFYGPLLDLLKDNAVDRNRDVNTLVDLIGSVCDTPYIGVDNAHEHYDKISTLVKRTKLTPEKLVFIVQEYVRFQGSTRWSQFMSKFELTSQNGVELSYDNYIEFVREWENEQNPFRLDQIKKNLSYRSREARQKRETQGGNNKRGRFQNSSVESSSNDSDSLEFRIASGPRCHYCKKIGHMAKDCKVKLSNTSSSNSQSPSNYLSRTEHPVQVLSHTVSSPTCSVIYDSGASVSIFNDRRWFSSMRTLDSGLSFDSIGHREIANEVGTVELKVRTTKGDTVTWRLHDVVYAPQAKFCLVSPNALHKQDTDAVQIDTWRYSSAPTSLLEYTVDAETRKIQLDEGQWNLPELHVEPPTVAKDSVAVCTQVAPSSPVTTMMALQGLCMDSLRAVSSTTEDSSLDESLSRVVAAVTTTKESSSDSVSDASQRTFQSINTPEDALAWHYRAAHAYPARVQALAQRHGFKLTQEALRSLDSSRLACSSCRAVAVTEKAVSSRVIPSSARAGEALVSDHLQFTCASGIDTTTKHALVIIDEYSRFSWIFVGSRDKAVAYFSFLLLNNFNAGFGVPAVIYTDEAFEFGGLSKSTFLQLGIRHEQAPARHHQSLGLAERKVRTLKQKTRQVLSHCKLPDLFWPFALHHVNWLHNHMPSSAAHLQQRTPAEVFGHAGAFYPHYLQPFGCDVSFSSGRQQSKNIQASHTTHGVYLGVNWDYRDSSVLIYVPRDARVVTAPIEMVHFYPLTFQLSYTIDHVFCSLVPEKDRETTCISLKVLGTEVAEWQAAHPHVSFTPVVFSADSSTKPSSTVSSPASVSDGGPVSGSDCIADKCGPASGSDVTDSASGPVSGSGALDSASGPVSGSGARDSASGPGSGSGFVSECDPASGSDAAVSESGGVFVPASRSSSLQGVIPQSVSKRQRKGLQYMLSRRAQRLAQRSEQDDPFLDINEDEPDLSDQVSSDEEYEPKSYDLNLNAHRRTARGRRAKKRICNCITTTRARLTQKMRRRLVVAAMTTEKVTWLNTTGGHSTDVSVLPKVDALGVQAQKSMSKALQQDPVGWGAARDAELDNMDRNNVWDVVELDRDKMKGILGLFWVLKVKVDAQGNPTKKKARLVALGNHQGYEQYNKTYAGVIQKYALCLFFQVVKLHDFFIVKMDVTAAFLQGNLDEEIYCWPPEGDETIPKGHVLRLNKALYGLKQAPRQWMLRLKEYCSTRNLFPMRNESSIYRKVDANGKLCCIMAVYVDDILMAGTAEVLREEVAAIKEAFEISDEGPVDEYLGIKVDDAKDGVCLSVPGSIMNMVDELRKLPQLQVKSQGMARTPLNPAVKKEIDEMFKAQDELVTPDDIKAMQRIAGCVNYLFMAGRLDLGAISVHLSICTQKPSKLYWKMARDLLTYLEKTKDVCLILDATQVRLKQGVVLYTDASFRQLPSGKAILGCLIYVNGMLVSWKAVSSKTHPGSTFEAEIKALKKGVRIAMGIREVAAELGLVSRKEPVKAYCDNGAAVVAVQGEYYAGNDETRYFADDVRQMQSLSQDKVFGVHHIGTEHMKADLLTKGFSESELLRLMSMVPMAGHSRDVMTELGGCVDNLPEYS